VIHHVWSVDPGDANNGFCYFKYDDETKRADVKMMEIFDGDGLENMLKVIWGIGSAKTESKPKLYFVVENFRIDGQVRNKIFQWSEVVTVRNIGKVEMVAKWLEASFTLQEPSILAMARKYSPVRLNKGHIRDDHSALLHGIYFMLKRNWIMTEDQVTLMGQEKLT
jgi:hypothetical protein